MIFGFLSHSAAAIAFSGLGVLLLVSRKGGGMGLVFIVACGLAAAWSASAAIETWFQIDLDPLANSLEAIRSAGWLVFTASIFAARREGGRAGRAGMALVAAILVLGLILIGLDVAQFRGDVRTSTGLELENLGRLVMAVAGLALVENMYRNSNPNGRWAIKHLCLGLGAIFAYDLYIYADALLFRRLDPDLLDARGATNALVVPLLAVSAARNREWSLDVFVSKRMAFHSTTLIGAGLYLLLMAGAGYYVRVFGGEWGTVLQITFLFAAVVLLGTVLLSGRFRAEVRVFLNKHFFSYKFDYREEWLRFIDTISSTDRSESLPERAVQAVADVVDSPEGALWIRREGGIFTLECNWHLPLGSGSFVATDDGLPRFLEEHAWVVNLTEVPEKRNRYPGLNLPPWIETIKRAWLVVPLHHHDRLLGFVVLGRPRARRELNWEDYDLLRTVGRQVASYLVEQEVEKALFEARQFAQFNRRFAFVLHDIKNLVSQLSLIVSNADKHAGNPEFQKDMVNTVRESVDRMNRLLARLNKGREEDGTESVVLGPLLTEIIGRRRTAGSASGLSGPDAEAGAAGLAVAADHERLASVFDHLIQNALDSTEGKGRVVVSLSRKADRAVIEITDDGPGMDSEFVRKHLFRPFGTTKAKGLGIGAFESREFIRSIGGTLDVRTAPGQGTTMRIDLPVLAVEHAGGPSTNMANAL